MDEVIRKSIAGLTLLLLTFVTACSAATDTDNPSSPQSTEQVDVSIYKNDEARAVGCMIAAMHFDRSFERATRPVEMSDASEIALILTQEEVASILANFYAGKEREPSNSARAEALLTLAREETIANCDELKAMKAEWSFIPDPEKEPSPAGPDNLFYEYQFVIVATPLVDLEHGKAFMWTGTVCGPLCGGEGIEIYTKQDDGTWQRADYVGLSIS